eukprot:SAG31_NODE_26562_length_440_cov_0.847507_1_plen_88_part_10
MQFLGEKIHINKRGKPNYGSFYQGAVARAERAAVRELQVEESLPVYFIPAFNMSLSAYDGHPGKKRCAGKPEKICADCRHWCYQSSVT